MYGKQYAIATFTDIKGAFDLTTFGAIQETLEKRNVGRTIIKWIVNILRCRSIHLTYQGSRAETKVVKNSPKEGYYYLFYGVC